jgi:hypothetical protein
LTILPSSITASMPWLLPGGAILSLLTFLALLALPFIGQLITQLLAWQPIRKLIPEAIEATMLKLVDQFNEGTRSLTNPVLYPAITLLSFLIWFLYWLNFYLIVRAFHLSTVVSPLNSLIAFAVSSVSVLVPTPGSIGSVHLLVSQALILTCGINKDVALSFATMLHALCFVLVPCAAALVCLAVNLYLDKRTRQQAKG